MILAPILICEFFWSLGENVYALIYGHLGTKSCAAMTLISSMVMLFMGVMGGVSQAAGLLSAFVFGLPIAPVYFLLSLEECVRLAISFVVFRKRKWMQRL